MYKNTSIMAAAMMGILTLAVLAATNQAFAIVIGGNGGVGGLGEKGGIGGIAGPGGNNGANAHGANGANAHGHVSSH